MNNLRFPETLESREVARMIEKQHGHLMRDIDNYVRYIGEIGESNSGFSAGEHNIVASDFFIATTYTSEQNKTLPCYLITRKGCELIGNKLTGVKGVQFTARYVHLFNEMEQTQQAVPPCAPDKLLRAQATLINAQTRQFEAIMRAIDAADSISPASMCRLRLRVIEAIFGIDAGHMWTLGNCEDAIIPTMDWGG